MCPDQDSSSGDCAKFRLRARPAVGCHCVPWAPFLFFLEKSDALFQATQCAAVTCSEPVVHGPSRQRSGFFLSCGTGCVMITFRPFA